MHFVDTPSALDNLIDVSSVALGYAWGIVEIVGDSPFLLAGIGIWFVGSCIGLSKRLIGKK